MSGLNVTFVPRCLRRADLLKSCLGVAATIALEVDLALALDLDLEILRERVHDRDADAVQTTRNPVGALVELAAGVQLREHDLGGRDLLGRVEVDGDAAPVVLDGDAVLDVDRDVDAVAMATERLVDRVVDDLEDEVVQARARRCPRCTSQAASERPRDPPGP